MSKIIDGLLFTSGMTREEVSLVSMSQFVADARSSGLLVACRRLVFNFVLRILWLLWKLFAPYVLVRQVLAVFILQVGHEAILPGVRRLLSKIFGERTTKEIDELDKRINDAEQQMQEAESYDEWREAARTVESFKNQKFGGKRDEVVNTKRVQRMRVKTELYNRLVEKEDVDDLQFRFRSELHRKSWGLGSTDDSTTREHPQYRAALHEYLDAVCSGLALIARGAKKKQHQVKDMSQAVEDDAITPIIMEKDESLEDKVAEIRDRVDFFSETLHSFGRTALLLSGGGRLGLVHLGVVRALLDQKLLPRVISGSSAGSIVAVMLGAWKDDELEEHLFTPANLNLRFFALANSGADPESSIKNPLISMLLLLPPPFPSLVNGVSQILPFWYSSGVLLDVNVLAKAIRDATGDLTFKEAFEKTGRIINITVSPSGDSDYPMLLNYLTAPRVLLWSASVASCAIPGVFAPVELMAKDMNGNVVPYFHETLKWADGSVESDLPMQRLSELFNINHFVVSQVNPHARVLAPMSLKGGIRCRDSSPINRALQTTVNTAEAITAVVVNFCRDQSRSSVKHLSSAMLLLSPVFPLFAPLKLLGKSLVPILTQKYTGDITIMPPLTMQALVTILANPSEDEYADDLRRGERITWPQISRMRLHVAIEFLLEDCRNTCRRQLARLEQELLEAGSVTRSPRMGSRSSLQQTPNTGGVSRTRNSIDHSGIPTASVLNLHELEVSSASFRQANRERRGSSASENMHTRQEPTVASYSTGNGRMIRNQSLLGLQDKLKSRVQSFAADLSILERNVKSDSIDHTESRALIGDDDDAESDRSGF